MRAIVGWRASRSVPAETEAAAGPQHAMDLGERPFEIEPVDARAGDDRVRLAVGDGNLLGRAVDAVEAVALENGEHARIRLDRDHAQPRARPRPASASPCPRRARPRAPRPRERTSARPRPATPAGRGRTPPRARRRSGGEASPPPRQRTRRGSTMPHVGFRYASNFFADPRRPGLREGHLHTRGAARLRVDERPRSAARVRPGSVSGMLRKLVEPRPRRARALSRRTPHRRGPSRRARGDPSSPAARGVPRGVPRHDLGRGACGGRGARARAVGGARGTDRPEARRSDRRPARRSDPHSRPQGRRGSKPQPLPARAGRGRPFRCVSRTRIRRCCASSPSAESCRAARSN